jgi:hypothetical protein
MNSLFRFFSSLPTGPTLIIIQGFSFLFWWVAGSYMGIDIFASKSFWGADGHCEPMSQGLGVHCWGDYYYPLWVSNSQNPFDGLIHNPYPAAALVPFMFFGFLSSTTGIPGLGITCYLVSMISLVFWSVWVATKGIDLEKRVILFVSLTVMAPPFLVAIDRGNSVGFLVPLLIWLFVSLQTNKSLGIVSSIALLSLIKPHFGLMVILVLVFGRKRDALLSVISGVVLNLLPYVMFWSSSFPTNISQSLKNIFSFQELSGVSQLFPTNISFSHGVYILSRVVDLGVPQIGGYLIKFVETNQGLIGFGVLAIVGVIVLTQKHRLSAAQSFVLLLSAISLTSSTTYVYYSVFAVPAIIALTYEYTISEKQLRLSEKMTTSKAKEIGSGVIWLASIFTLTQFPIFGLSDGPRLFTSSSLVGLVWILAYLVVTVSLFSESRVSKFERGA